MAHTNSKPQPLKYPPRLAGDSRPAQNDFLRKSYCKAMRRKIAAMQQSTVKSM